VETSIFTQIAEMEGQKQKGSLTSQKKVCPQQQPQESTLQESDSPNQRPHQDSSPIPPEGFATPFKPQKPT
jgi:hypothetical protein